MGISPRSLGAGYSLRAMAEKRTPLFERTSTPGPGSFRSPAGRCPSSTRASRQEHLAVRDRLRRLRRLAHGRGRDRGPAARRTCSSGCSRTTSRRSRSAALSTRCSAARTAASSTTSSPTGSADDRYLTVTNAVEPRARPRPGSQSTPAASTPRSTTASPTGRCSPSRAPRLAASSRASLGASCRSGSRDGLTIDVARGRVPRLRHGLHGRGRRRDPAARPSTRRALWDALVDAGATPAGLGARDTLRLEVCFHLYGNDLAEDRNPIEAGLGWCCKEETGFIGSEPIAAARADGTAREARPVRPAPSAASRARATTWSTSTARRWAS